MYKFYFRACLFVTLLVFPYVIYAAGLGKLTLSSALGQPLKAEIDLVAVRDEESSSLTANLASQEAFRQAGISYKPFFSSLEITIDQRTNGDSYIRITSPSAINEPFLNMLVELSWASGRLMREYTVLLDPIDVAPPEPVAPVIVDVPVPVAVETEVDEPEIQAEIDADTPEVQAEPVIEQVEEAPAVVSEPFSGDTYGPVSQGDTLSKIAQQISPEGANLNQIMIAVFRANQGAFIGNNINLLKVGEILHIPSNSEILEISEQDANAEVKVHVADWRDYKNELAGVSSDAPAAETLKQVDTGEIITAVEDEIVALDAQPEEVLRLSGGVAEDMLGSANGESSQDRIRMMEEDSIARSLALIEANERIELLEKNIKNLQQLLELKDPAMAKAQMQAENMHDEVHGIHEEASSMHEEVSIDDLVPESIDDVLPALEKIIDITEQELDELFSSDAELEESIAALDFVEDVVDTLAESPTEAPVETASEAPAEASIMDQLMDNIAYVGGLLAFVLLSVLIAIKIRRKKAEADADEDDLDFDASSSLRNRVAAVSTADSLSSNAEADVSQASEDSLASEAGSESQAENEASFDTENAKEDTDEIDLDFSQNEAVDESPAESVAISDESDDLSQQILEPDLDSGSDIDLDLDSLDEGDKTDDNEQPIELTDELIQENADVSVEDSLTDDKTDSDDELAFTDEAIASLEEAIQNERQAVDETNASEVETESEAAGTTQSENELDFEFNLDADNQADVDSSPAVAEEADSVTEDTAEADNSISFDLDTPAVDDIPLDQGASEEAEPQAQEEKLDLSIDFPEEPEAPVIADETPVDAGEELADSMEAPVLPVSETDAESDEHDEHWQDVETKIDLAKAYIDMDDNEGAKEILEEVTQEGDADQQERAKSMLGDLS